MRSSSLSYFNTVTPCTQAAGGAAPSKLAGRGEEVSEAENLPANCEGASPVPTGGGSDSSRKQGPRRRVSRTLGLPRFSAVVCPDGRPDLPSSTGSQGPESGDGEKLEMKSFVYTAR